MCAEGVRVLERFAEAVRGMGADASEIDKGTDALGDQAARRHRLGAATSPRSRGSPRGCRCAYVSPQRRYTLLVERERALYGAWYEVFPRSEGAHRDPETGRGGPGTFRTAAERLPAIADLGFDVVYLTPIHPIGTTARKGGTTRCPRARRPRVSYAIGSPDGGHDAIHPTSAPSRTSTTSSPRPGATARGRPRPRAAGLARPPVGPEPSGAVHDPRGRHDRLCREPAEEVPGHLPLNFDNDPASAYAEVRRVIQVWLDHGIRIFRVDNPHTKPVPSGSG